MTHHNAIKYIKASPNIIPSDASAPERILKLFSALGNPQKNKKFLRLAGNNGKTVCAKMLISILNKSNIKNGCLLMPIHADISENIKINGNPISIEETVRYVEAIAQAVSNINQASSASPAFRPTEQEILLAMAFLAFAEHGCSIAIIESNNQSYDPSKFLHAPFAAVICGRVPSEEPEEIAKIRSYLAKHPKEIVSCPVTPEAHKDIEQICTAANCRRTLAARSRCKIESINLRGARFIYKDKPYEIKLCGKFQITNALIAIETAQMLAKRFAFPITDDAIQKGLASVEAPCKFELISYSPTIIADSTHASVAIATICTSLADFKTVMGTKIHLCLPEGKLVPKYIEALKSRGYTVEKVYLLCEADAKSILDDYTDLEDEIEFIRSKTAKKTASVALKSIRESSNKDCTLFVSGDSNFTITIRRHLLDILGFGF